MDFEVGSILTGKVTGITKFGAFVTLAPGKSGLVHISEIANSYVSNVSDFLAEGQEVKVKVLSIDDAGRINLSIKQALPPPERKPRPQPQQRRQEQPERRSFRSPVEAEEPRSADAAFEDKLKRFMQDSDSKMAGLYADRKSSRRRRG
ncbi:MAG: S1 RNA-binding domain-containing protein [Oscillospiraceae bacterium]|nr:S1 RNA-binding domain-containing protein [Oscillospiraceae bacterium]